MSPTLITVYQFKKNGKHVAAIRIVDRGNGSPLACYFKLAYHPAEVLDPILIEYIVDEERALGCKVEKFTYLRFD